jgi:Domain of unknown function (DUF5010)/DUF5010 C-terminal domain
LFVVIDNSWRKGDTTITGVEADGVQNWFCCGNAGTFFTFNNHNVGVCVPGFGIFDSVGAPKAHGATFDRGHGARLKQFLDSSITVKADIMIEEGYVDIRESAGIYRSSSWDFPSQYLEIVREFLDQKTETRRFQAEACDSFSSTSTTNQGGQFSTRAVGVGSLAGSGWYVGWTEAGDWLKWKAPFFASGNYDIFLRYSSTAVDNRIVLSLAGKNDTISLPSTLGAFQGKKIISSRSLSGNNDVKITFLTAGIQVDFLQVNLSDVTPVVGEAAKPSPLLAGVKIISSHGAVRIEYPVPFDNDIVDLRISSLSGRIVRQYHDIRSGKGRHSVDWVWNEDAPGAYIVGITVKDDHYNVYAPKRQRCIFFR